MMRKALTNPRVIWITVVLGTLLVITYILHSRNIHAALLRTDPDLIPALPALMNYAQSGGRSTFRSYCRNCHGERGVGDPSRGVPALSDTDWLYGTGLVSDIERSVAYGIRSNHPKAWNLAAMPAFGRLHPSQSNPLLPPLTPNQIHDVIEYLVQQQHRPANAAAALRGAQIYQASGACYDCHSPDAQGDNAIGAPNLTDNVTLYGSGDRASLYDSVANGHQGVCPAWVQVLSPLAIREVSLYVYSLSHSAALRMTPAP